MELKSAFASVSVTLLMSILMSLSLGWWRQASFSYDIVVARESYYKKLYKTEQFLFRVLAFAKVGYPDNTGDVVNAQGRAIVERRGDALFVKVSVEPGFCIRCYLVQKKDCFFIKHYTISTRTVSTCTVGTCALSTSV